MFQLQYSFVSRLSLTVAAVRSFRERIHSFKLGLGIPTTFVERQRLRLIPRDNRVGP
jgi:hypothetical protein